MQCCSLDTQELQTLLAHFPQLSELSLDIMHAFTSLAFLEPVRATLRSLTVGRCRGWIITADSLRFLQTFGLTHLSLGGSHSYTPLDAALLQALTPPTELIPSLEQFENIPHRDVTADSQSKALRRMRVQKLCHRSNRYPLRPRNSAAGTKLNR